MHLLFLVRHGERADQKDTKVAFRESGLAPHDPPLRSVFGNKGKRKEESSVVGVGEGAPRLPPHHPLSDTSSDEALDRSSVIVNSYLGKYGELVRIARGSNSGSNDDGDNNTQRNKSMPGTIALTSPLQRCVTTLAHIMERWPMGNHSTNDTNGSGGPIVTSDKYYHCDVRLYEYLAAGLFPMPKPPKQPRGSAAGRVGEKGKRVKPTNTDEGRKDEDLADEKSSKEAVTLEELSTQSTGSSSTCPIPYAYDTANGPHTDRLAYYHIGNNTYAPLDDESHRDGNDSPNTSALQYIYNRFPETKQTAEKRFEDFIDDHLGKMMVLRGVDLPTSSSPAATGGAPTASYVASIICTHQFGVSAMMSHMLRKYMTKAPLLSTDVAADKEDSTNTSGETVKYDWRVEAEKWAAVYTSKLSAEEQPNITGGCVSPQFTPRIDTSSVTVIAVWAGADGKLTCAPVTVGEL